MATERGSQDLVIAVVVAVALVAAGAYVFDQQTGDSGYFTGRVVDTTYSRVTIQKYVAIALSTNLSVDGIDYGIVTTLPTIERNGSANYGDLNKTNYTIDVAQDSNTAVDFCIKADGDLNTTGGATIGLANETWADNTVNNVTLPASYGASLTTAYVTGSTNVGAGATNNYRFWLNISAATLPGTYNNTVFFQGVPTGDPCN